MDETLKIEVLNDDFSQYDLNFKSIVIGNSSVGKSCLTIKAIKDVFEPTYSATVGFDFFTFNIKINDQIIKLHIWDTCGQEEYKSLVSNFYRNSSLAILVYAINDKASFKNLEMWLNEVKTLCSPDVKIILIGNKNDLESNREVSKEEEKKFCEDHNFDLFFETSAKTGLNAQKVFIEGTKILYKEYLKCKEKESKSDFLPLRTKYEDKCTSTIDDDESIKRRNKKGKCC